MMLLVLSSFNTLNFNAILCNQVIMRGVCIVCSIPNSRESLLSIAIYNERPSTP